MLIHAGEFCFNSPVFIIQERSFIFSGGFYLILLGIFIISVIVGYFVNLQRLKNQNEELKKIIDERTRDIQKQNRQLTEQSHKLESYFRSTSESIRYASKIQSALLPHPGLLQECFEDSFIYLNPKEDISGDFYWLAHVGNKIVIATVDCTGHGVPGAFMSVLGGTLLNQLVVEKQIWRPDLIMEGLNERVEAALKQNEDDNTTYDGFDIGLCTIIPDKQQVLFTGAKRPLAYSFDGEIKFITASKYAIGGGQLGHNKQYDTKTLSFEEVEYLYLFTDGILDQFGGSGNKKFSKSRFVQLLTEIHHHHGTVQKQKIEQAIKQWQRDYDQVDDMLVVGLRLDIVGDR